MYEVLTSPITLLCLGVVFLLISLLFFYFKRSLSLLERAQMEQARVLQSFITNMEMTRLRQYQPPEQHTPSYNDHHVGGQSDIVHTESNEQLIDVSDDDSDDSDDSGDSDDDSDDDSDSDNDEETANNENVSAVSSNRLSILEIDELGNNEDEIKVIQLQENNLEEIVSELLEVNELHTMGEEIQYKMTIDNSDSRSDTSSDTDSDDENVSETNDILQNEPITSIHKIPSVQDLMTSSDLKIEHISTDLKTLTLQKLRQIAVEKELIQTGSKPNKKELIKLIEDSTQ
jgi:hypothetical protein